MIIVKLIDWNSQEELATAYMTYLPRINDMLTYITHKGDKEQRFTGTVMDVQHTITHNTEDEDRERWEDLQEVTLMIRTNR